MPERHPQSERFHQILKELGDLHDKKQADYGRGHDPFANVRGSQEWGVDPWVGAMVRATDKLKRLQKYAQDGVLENEGARDSFLDLAVYAVIGLVLWEDQYRRTSDSWVDVTAKEGEIFDAVERWSSGEPACCGCDRDQMEHNFGCPQGVENAVAGAPKYYDYTKRDFYTPAG